MKIILAVSSDGYIADKHGNIPWKLPRDMKWFKMNTVNTTIGMGRKTWESLPKPLSHRHHLILSTRPMDLSFDDDVEQVGSITKFKNIIEQHNGWIIGGANVASQFFYAGNILVLTTVFVHVGNGVSIVLPTMKPLWESKPMEENGIRFKFGIYKIICK